MLAVDVGPLAERGYFIGPHIFADVKPDSPLGAGRNLRPGAGGDPRRRFGRSACDRQRHRLRPDRRAFSRSPAHLSRAPASCWHRQSLSEPRHHGRLVDGNRSAASSSPASATKPAGPTICCNLSCRARSPKTRCAAASPRARGWKKRSRPPSDVGWLGLRIAEILVDGDELVFVGAGRRRPRPDRISC